VNPHFRHLVMLDPEGDPFYREGHFAPFEIFFHNGARAETAWVPKIERLDRPFLVPSSPGLVLPAGEYSYSYWQFEGESDMSLPLFATAEIQVGEYYTGHSQTYNVSGTYRPGYRWSVQGTFVNSHISLIGTNYTNRVVRTRLNYSINTRMFLNALIQYNSVRNQVTSNVRFDFIHRPLSDLYLVYNEARDTSGLGRDDRVFTVKYTHMLAF
jgi:hypothetical protein